MDTSVFIATEQGRLVEQLPEVAVSVVTLAELHVGVLAADEPAIRARRLRTLAEVERRFDPLPIDPPVARQYAALVADARRRGRRPKVMDTFIAATAAVHGLTIYTFDVDFEAFPGVQMKRL